MANFVHAFRAISRQAPKQQNNSLKGPTTAQQQMQATQSEGDRRRANLLTRSIKAVARLPTLIVPRDVVKQFIRVSTMRGLCSEWKCQLPTVDATIDSRNILKKKMDHSQEKHKND
mmetsp:Transcript_13936/g.27827  ORF Transcript_13936/g.27827 Transcript_13936/m.27827 type:complete len:116 (+) Transcript_13936:819-1166(+)